TEDNNTGIATGGTQAPYTIKLLGSISRSNLGVGIYQSGGGANSYNVTVKDTVTLQNNIGNQVDSGTNMVQENVTAYGNTTQHYFREIIPLPNRSTYVKNSLNINGGNGFKVVNQDDWWISYTNSSGNSPNWPVAETINDGAGLIRNSMSVAPTGIGLGTNQCLVYVPASSNMKGAGEGGADIGANIIYSYENGVLNTTKKIWCQSGDTRPNCLSAGQFSGCGAVITGVNDNATYPNSSCVNVHKRLNVGVNGCPIP
ncbi:MAG TPA: hypothetical protein VHT73_10410, partial [Thermodesulfobacteriota bacterium]|nr:hypothetical protein [Thermodesulfobacteriota bacterium]